MVKTDVSEEHIATCPLYTRRDSPVLKMEVIRSSETLVLTITTRHKIPEDDFLHRHCRENLKSYLSDISFTCAHAAYIYVKLFLCLSTMVWFFGKVLMCVIGNKSFFFNKLWCTFYFRTEKSPSRFHPFLQYLL
jgi:hypothetical protein